MRDEYSITRRFIGKLPTSMGSRSLAVQVKSSLTVHVLEMEDVNFHYDSAVLLPDYGPDAPQQGSEAQNRITGIGVLFACYKHARENPNQTLLITGHTDRSGTSDYNLSLSRLRSESVLHALKGNKLKWIAVAEKKHKIEDYQQILKWVSYNWKWDCDPGPKTNSMNNETREATRKFQERYNEEFPTPIHVTGIVEKETWGAFFDVYMRELSLVMGINEAGLAEQQVKLQLMDEQQPSVGCGENWPITPDRAENYRSPVDRRVELLFFDPGEEPGVDTAGKTDSPGITQKKLECHPKPGMCIKSKCQLYGTALYVPKPIPCDPLPLPSGLKVPVCLELSYEDPEGNRKFFPENVAIGVQYRVGEMKTEIVQADGKLKFDALRNWQAFTVKLRFSQDMYIASAPPKASGVKDELIAGTQVNDYHTKGYRLFLLPRECDLKTATWDITNAATFDPNDAYFKKLDDTSVVAIGSDASPVKVKLKPVWQHAKFVYFDRLLNDRLALPPILVEGIDKAGNVVARSNWRIDKPHACQCLPWILQSPPMPDKESMIRIRSAENTFIESFSNGNRRIVTVDASKLSATDAGVNVGTNATFTPDTPNEDRLRFYDLPIVWKSFRYRAHLLKSGSGDTPAKSDEFEKLIGEKSSPQTPFLFSLDDLILTKIGLDGSTLEPAAWTPNDRAALFSHKFEKAGNADLSDMGLFKPDNANKQSYLTQKPASGETTRNYIADYPNWTRLVVAQGHLYHVFDKRTPDKPGSVVGARAAVRVLDDSDLKPDAGATVSVRGTHPTSFLTISYFQAQDHDRFWTPDLTDSRDIGRFDLALLRCCDIKNGKEVAVIFQYHRYTFDFSDATLPNNLSADAAKQKEYTSKAARNIAARWNGPDPKYNPDPAIILPEDPGKPFQEDPARKLIVRILRFVEIMPGISRAHYKVDVKKEVRAHMNSTDGTGQFSEDDNEPDSDGSFTAAHETGHAASLGDEYVESSKSASYRSPGFYSFSPGAPYVLDETGMMKGNEEIRSRYYWHLAEWLCSLDSKRRYFVKQDGHAYGLPSHKDTPKKSYVNFPLEVKKDHTQGGRGRMDLILCPLGNDKYSRVLVPGHALDGELIVIVRMKFTFHSNDYDDIRSAVSNINRDLQNKFNRRTGGNFGRWYATGDFSSATAPPFSFKKCLIQISPRFLVTNFPDNDSDAEEYAKKMNIREPTDLTKPFDKVKTKKAYDVRIDEIEKASEWGYHAQFEVLVGKVGAFSSSSATWQTANRLLIMCPFLGSWTNSVAGLLMKEFPKMIGINKTPDSIAGSDLLPIVQTLIKTNASVKDF